MGHIHSNHGEHDLTASAFIVRTDFDQPKILFHMHKKLHTLLQPGGHVELHENPWDAVQHEITEETGYSLDQLHVLQPKDRLKAISAAILHPQPVLLNTHNFDTEGAHKHTDITYTFTANEAPNGVPEDGESTDIRWLGQADIENPNEPMFDNVREIALYVLSITIKKWEAVPVTSAAFNHDAESTV